MISPMNYHKKQLVQLFYCLYQNSNLVIFKLSFQSTPSHIGTILLIINIKLFFCFTSSSNIVIKSLKLSQPPLLKKRCKEALEIPTSSITFLIVNCSNEFKCINKQCAITLSLDSQLHNRYSISYVYILSTSFNNYTSI